MNLYNLISAFQHRSHIRTRGSLHLEFSYLSLMSFFCTTLSAVNSILERTSWTIHVKLLPIAACSLSGKTTTLHVWFCLGWQVSDLPASSLLLESFPWSCLSSASSAVHRQNLHHSRLTPRHTRHSSAIDLLLAALFDVACSSRVWHSAMPEGSPRLVSPVQCHRQSRRCGWSLSHRPSQAFQGRPRFASWSQN